MRLRPLFSLFVLLAAAIPASAPAQTAVPPAAPAPVAKAEKVDPHEKELMKAEIALMDAVKGRDRGALEKLVASEFAYTGPLSTGDLTRRDPFIASQMGGIKVDSFRFEKVLVRSFGDVAVVNNVCRQTGSVGGRPWNPDYLYTDVWVKRDGRWQIVSRHVTRPIRIEAPAETPKGAPYRPAGTK